MAQALPLTKLAGLLVKTLAKPLSKRIKHEFSRYEVTQNILIGIGQTSHSVTSRFTVWSAGYKIRSITPLEPDKAMKQGAEFVGEGFIFLVSGGLVVWEYNRSKEKERLKEENRRQKLKDERQALQSKLNALDARLQALEVVVKNNSNSILNIAGQRYVDPSENDVVPINDDDEKEHVAGKERTVRSGDNDSKQQIPKGKGWSLWRWPPWPH